MPPEGYESMSKQGVLLGVIPTFIVPTFTLAPPRIRSDRALRGGAFGLTPVLTALLCCNRETSYMDTCAIECPQEALDIAAV